MGKSIAASLGRRTYVTVKLDDGRALPVFKESGAITSMAHAHGYIEIPENVENVEKGELVEVHLF